MFESQPAPFLSCPCLLSLVDISPDIVTSPKIAAPPDIVVFLPDIASLPPEISAPSPKIVIPSHGQNVRQDVEIPHWLANLPFKEH